MTDTQKKVMDALDQFVDKVLAYRPEKATKKSEKKKAEKKDRYQHEE